jgi:hypothetical protein
MWLIRDLLKQVSATFFRFAASRILTRATVLFALTGLGQASILYDNSQYYSKNSYGRPGEFGDEVRLGLTNRVVSEFSFEYFGDFVPEGDETARVRLYANDGEDTDPHPTKVIPAPGALLFDSGVLPIGPGFNAFFLQGLSVPVPPVFTWTVEFAGLGFTNGNTASVLFFDPPTVGRSYDDFWVKTASGWALYRLNGNPVANFGMRVASAQATEFDISKPLAAGGDDFRLTIRGPVGRSFTLEFSTNALEWVSLNTLTMTNHVIEYLHRGALAFPVHYYRASMLPQTRLELLRVARQPNGSTRLLFTGPIDALYEVQASPDLRTWRSILTNVFPAGFAYFDDAPVAVPQRFYRVRLANPPPVSLDVAASHPVNQVYQVGVSGPPGKAVLIQATTDLANWTTLSTNRLSYTTGAATVVDWSARTNDLRFYRVIPAP